LTARIVISGDEKSGFTWQLVEAGKVVKAGHTDSQARAVVAGQDALIEYKRKRRWDRAWSASTNPIVSSRAKR
jgi:hypothetical protein